MSSTTPETEAVKRSVSQAGAAVSAARLPDEEGHAPVVTSPTLIAVAGAVAALYFGKDIFLPLAVAVLLTFALAPVVSFMRRFRIPRTAAVVIGGGRGLRGHHPVRGGGRHAARTVGGEPAALSVQHREQGARGQGGQCRRRHRRPGLEAARTVGARDQAQRRARAGCRNRSGRGAGGAPAARRGRRAGAAALASAADDHRAADRASGDRRHHHRRGHLHADQARGSARPLHPTGRRQRSAPNHRGACRMPASASASTC